MVPLGSGPAGNLPKSQTLNRKGLPRVLGSGLVPLGSRRRVDAGYVSLLGLLFAPSRSARRNTIRSADVGGCRISSQNARRNKNKPKRANLVFCTTDKTNSPPTDQSVDYSVLSPRTNEAPLDDGDPIQCSRPAAFTPWNVVSTPTTPTTSCPHNPLQDKYYMTPTGCAPLTGRNRSCPIISWVGH